MNLIDHCRARGWPFWATEDGRVLLLNADCLDVLPLIEAGSVDAVVTDPPYSSGGLHRAARAKAINEKYVTSGATIEYSEFSGDARDQRSWTSWCSWWLRMCQRALRDNGYCLSFCDWRQLPALSDAVQWADLTWCGILPWNKGLGSRAGNTSMFRHQCEYIVWSTKGGTAGYDDRTGPWPGFFECGPVPPTQRDHQSEKPLAVLREILACCNPGELVLDAFAGSGSTGEAAVSLGMRFIGMELDANNFAIAIDRIKAELNRTALFEPPPKILQQRSLLET